MQDAVARYSSWELLYWVNLFSLLASLGFLYHLRYCQLGLNVQDGAKESALTVKRVRVSPSSASPKLGPTLPPELSFAPAAFECGICFCRPYCAASHVSGDSAGEALFSTSNIRQLYCALPLIGYSKRTSCRQQSKTSGRRRNRVSSKTSKQNSITCKKEKQINY